MPGEKQQKMKSDVTLGLFYNNRIHNFQRTNIVKVTVFLYILPYLYFLNHQIKIKTKKNTYHKGCIYLSSPQSVFSHVLTKHYFPKLPKLCNEQSERGEYGHEVNFRYPFEIRFVLNKGNIFGFEQLAFK